MGVCERESQRARERVRERARGREGERERARERASERGVGEESLGGDWACVVVPGREGRHLD